MAIIRVKKRENPYVMMDKTGLKDPNLSFRAKGMLSYLLSKPDDWQPVLEEMVKASKDGYDSVKSGFAELRRCGYMKKIPIHGPDGKFMGWERAVYEVPLPPEERKPDRNSHKEGKPPGGKTTERKNHSVENPRLINNDLLINKDLNNNIVPFAEIIDYLNTKCGTKYRVIDSNRKHIRARWEEGFRLDDFKTVIDKKYDEWVDTEQAKYLRPETLFGTKFNSYLNHPVVKKAGKQNNKPVIGKGDACAGDYSEYDR
ncbi:conserved phage C-terminal domain-containing protein [Acetonema longum]|nr:conserved phage C-terminal domain-containing protein [Acetonema longum]